MTIPATGIIEPLDLPGAGPDVGFECEGFVEMKEGLELVDDLRQGTKRLRERHERYLPKFSEEKDHNYKRRWQSATLYNAFEETVGMLVGKAFAKPPTLDKDVPTQISGGESAETEGLIENIDLQGNHFDVFSQSLFKDALRSGLCYILVDMSPAPEGIITKADEIAAGIRPYWTKIKASQVIGWITETNGGLVKLVQVRIREQAVVKDGDFSVKVLEQIRVLHIGSYQLFRKDPKQTGGSWELYEQREMKDSSGTPLTFIPLIPFYTDEDNDYMTAIPPLVDLAYMNIRHFQKQSDYDNCMTVACFPILYISGYSSEQDKIALGPQTLIKLTDPAAKAGFAEHSGNALGAARQGLEDMKEEMAMYGLKMLVSRPGQTVTATQEAISEARTSYSQLQVAMLRLKDALELALEYTAKWMGLDSGGSVKVDINDLVLNPNDVDNLLKAAGAPQKPVLDPETVIQQLKDRGWLIGDVDPKEIVARLQQAAQAGSLAALSGSFLKAPQGPPPEKVPPGTPVQ